MNDDKQWVVELQDGLWLSTWRGDPGRSLVVTSAQGYKTERGAKIALGKARRWSPFKDARIYRRKEVA
jgi:hypothetical protein